MSIQASNNPVVNAASIEPPRDATGGGPRDPEQGRRTREANDMAHAFADSARAASGDATASRALDLRDMWSLACLSLPPRADGFADIVVPQALEQDSRRRAVYRLGVMAARELGLDAGQFSLDDLLALGRQILIDHALSGNVQPLLAGMARLEGRLDEAAWAANDTERIAEQVHAFLRSEFKAEFAVYEALQDLAGVPPLVSRKGLADEFLRRHGIDPDVHMQGENVRYAYNRYSPATNGRPFNWKAGDYYFNKDRLTADDARKMRTPGDGVPSDAQIAGLLRALPQSLDAEFGKRFDAHKAKLSTHLAQWLAARLSLHARDASIDLSTATVTVSRAKMRYEHHVRVDKTMMHAYGRHSEIPARGYVVSIRAADRVHRCFVSTETGAVHAVPPGDSIENWLKQAADVAFDSAKTLAELAAQNKVWRAVPVVEQMGAGSHAERPKWLVDLFQADIEQGREAARGQTPREGATESLLDLIPFRAMIVSLQKGDIGAAMLWGGLDLLSIVVLLPLAGPGMRGMGMMARAGGPLAGAGTRVAGGAGRQAVRHLRLLPGGLSRLRQGIQAGLTGTAARSWACLRPLDVRRVAAALRTGSPKLADALDRLAARAAGVTIPEGVWQVGRRAGEVPRRPASAAIMAGPVPGGAGAASAPLHGGSAAVSAPSRGGSAVVSVPSRGGSPAAAGWDDAIGTLSPVTARGPAGRELALLPYGNGAGAYTQVDTVTGARTGALLVADDRGRLYPTLPVASLERYRVSAPAVIRMLEARRAGTDGTVALDGAHYARLGTDYVEVALDRAVSTVERPIWRVLAPAGVSPDIVAHRLVYDAEKRLWRHTDAPGLSGQGAAASSQGGGKVAAKPRIGACIAPGALQQGRFRAALLAGLPETARQQIEVILERIGGKPRGRIILNALCAYHALHGRAPKIVLATGPDATNGRPSLAYPASGETWSLDLDALRFASTDAAIQELAAVYNNLTGLLQDGEPFKALLAKGEPALDPALERAWSNWIARDPDHAFFSLLTSNSASRASYETSRESAVALLRDQLREMRCHGGVDRQTLSRLLVQDGDAYAHISLTYRSLDSVPPLPDDITSLNISHNTIRDWTYLPSGLLVLHAENTDMMELPPNLSAGLLELDVSNNALDLANGVASFPPKLRRVSMARNALTVWPDLPDSVEEAVLHHNRIQRLPRRWPPRLKLVDVSSNLVTEIPTPLPADLVALYARNNLIGRLPEQWPVRLQVLDVSMNRLASLPDTLPDTLTTLEAGFNALTALPAYLPPGMKVIYVERNRLTRLPAHLPLGLTRLEAQWNSIAELPPNILDLVSCTIHLDGNPIPLANLPRIAQGRAAPRIFFSMAGVSGTAQVVRGDLSAAARSWLTGRTDDVGLRWDAIARATEGDARTAEFAGLLVKLHETVMAQDPAFRAQVADWLEELAKPERESLLDDTLNECVEATRGCDDLAISIWNDLQVLRYNDDVRRGVYDGRVNAVVDLARQVFYIHALHDVARQKQRTLALDDAVEVYLAFLTRLRDDLGLTTVAPRMRHYEASFVDDEDVIAARDALRARAALEFDKFLVLDYGPWQTLLKRKDAEAYAKAEQAAHRDLDAKFDEELEKEVAKLGLAAENAAALADAKKDLGPGIMRQIRYEAMAPLTRTHASAEASAVPVDPTAAVDTPPARDTSPAEGSAAAGDPPVSA